MGAILIVGCGVDPGLVENLVARLGKVGHSVEVVTSPEKARELMEKSQPAPAGLNPDLERLVLSVGVQLEADEFECIQFGSNDAKKGLPRAARNVYGSRRSRAGRAARWS